MSEYLPIWIGLIIFFALAWKMDAHTKILNALDARSNRIAAELAEAKRLREEAEAIVAEYRKRQASAEQEARDIVTAARGEAERLAAEGKAKIEEFVSRRTKMAETKIAQAEAQAVADVRAAAADAATIAAGSVLADLTKGAGGDKLITSGIAEIKAKLN
ncbi:ATP F0F1 synthase subunit B [Phreatobacter sp. HK31-P]